MDKQVLELINNNEILESETLRQLYPNMSDSEIETILVLKNAKHTNTIFEDMDVFENAIHALNGITPNIENMEGCLPEHIWYGNLKLKKIRPDLKYSDEVKAYISYIFHDNGFEFYPENIGIKNPKLDKIKKDSMSATHLPETPENIQTIKYLKMLEYVKIKDKI